MAIFVGIAIAAFIVVAGGFLFSHDHDLSHDFDHDVGHGGGPDTGGIISIFSTRVVFTFIMGFGAAGAIANAYGADNLIASLIGIAAGVVLGAIMYGIMLLFVEQQASSIIPADSLVGCTGTVTVPIDKDSLGEIGVSVAGEYRAFAARLQGSGTLEKGHTVRIVGMTGSVLTVAQEEGKTE
jgi:membrane protein implicated in regulation of membrane protease activity